MRVGDVRGVRLGPHEQHLCHQLLEQLLLLPRHSFIDSSYTPSIHPDSIFTLSLLASSLTLNRAIGESACEDRNSKGSCRAGSGQ
eukprot:764098-Hanusia_phi.AAC.1